MTVGSFGAMFLTFGVLTFSHCVFAQGTDSNDLQQQLVQIEQKWLDAESDPEALQKALQTILADDFIHVYPTGFVNKKEQIDYLRTHPAAIRRADRRFEDLKVRIFGTTGIVTGIVAADPGDGSIHETAFTDVFVYRDGKWQAVNAQESPMTQSSNPATRNSVAALPPNLEDDVRAGNQAWIEGLKANDFDRAASAYQSDAIFCTAAGECLKGAAAIASMYKQTIDGFGPVVARDRFGRVLGGAFVLSDSLWIDHDGLAYETGYAEVDFPLAGYPKSGRYSTVWKLQSDGHWKILRNCSLGARGSRALR